MKLAAILIFVLSNISIFATSASAADFKAGTLNCISADNNTKLKVEISSTTAFTKYNNVTLEVTARTEDSLILVGEIVGWDSYYYQLNLKNDGSALLIWDENIDCLGHASGEIALLCKPE